MAAEALTLTLTRTLTLTLTLIPTRTVALTLALTLTPNPNPHPSPDPNRRWATPSLSTRATRPSTATAHSLSSAPPVSRRRWSTRRAACAATPLTWPATSARFPNPNPNPNPTPTPNPTPSPTPTPTPTPTPNKGRALLGLGEAAAALAAFERGLLLCAQGGEQRTEEGLRDGAAEAQRALQRRRVEIMQAGSQAVGGLGAGARAAAPPGRLV